MNKKAKLPLAAVIALAAAWTLLTKKGVHHQINISPEKHTVTRQTVTVTQDVDPNENLTDAARAIKIREILTWNDAEKSIEIHSITCQKKNCTIEASAPGDPALLQKTMASLLETNPWLGSRIDIKTLEEKNEVVSFTFVKE